MSKPVVDLTNLIEMIGDDIDMQQELFKEFISSFENGLKMLDANLSDDNKEIWRTQAHAMKGISFNLGAEPLGELCKQAQESKDALAEEKTELLRTIHHEYQNVKAFLADYLNNQ